MFMLAKAIRICNNAIMCEFNQRMVMPPHSYHDISPLSTQTIEEPISPWATRAEQLPEDEVAVIKRALEEASALECDLHLFRKTGSRFLGLALKASAYDRSMIIEHPTS